MHGNAFLGQQFLGQSSVDGVTYSVAGTLAGTGAIAGNIVGTGIAGNFAGNGSISGTANLTGSVAGALVGTGTITGLALAIGALAGDLAGNGSIAGTIFSIRSVSGALVGVGVINASSIGILLQVSGSLVGIGDFIGYAKMWPAPSSASWIPGRGQAVVFISSAEGKDSLWIGDGIQESSVVPDGGIDPNWVVADKAANGNFSKNVTGI